MTVRVKLRGGDSRPVLVSQDLYKQLPLDDQRHVFLSEVDHAARYYAGCSWLPLDRMPITAAAHQAMGLPVPVWQTMPTEPLLHVIDQALGMMRDAAGRDVAQNVYDYLLCYLSRGRLDDLPYSRRTLQDYKRIALHALAHHLSEIVGPHAPWVPWMPLPTRPRRVLTSREHEVLLTTAAGYSSAEAAQILAVTVSTIRKHWRNLHRKLDTTNRVEALRVAHDRGLISLSQPAPAQEVQCG